MPALCALANSCVTILLAVLWGRPYGLYGVALATLLGDILCGLLVYPQLANRFLELKPGRVDWTVYSTLATLVPLFLGTFCIARYLDGGWAVVAFLALMTAWMVPAAYLAFGREGLARIQMALQKRIPRLG
jgi:peptidoglycan biosynthesis protein MviN/MurJ (putative lipid II flippase)